MSKIAKIPVPKKIKSSYSKVGSSTKTGRVRTHKASRKSIRTQVDKHVKKNDYGNAYGSALKSKLTEISGTKTFPGRIKGSTKYTDGTPGRFVKSIRGQPGKFFLEKGTTMAISEYMNIE